MLQKKEMIKNKNYKDKVINSLVGWMENLEDTPTEELYEIRKELGHNVEKENEEFFEILKNGYKDLGIDLVEEKKTNSSVVEGILINAKSVGISISQLADITGLSIRLVAQFDRRLIKVNENLPKEVVKRIAEAINLNVDQIWHYLQGSPRFANNFKATDSPIIAAKQDFSEAVEQDETLPEERLKNLRTMIKNAGR